MPERSSRYSIYNDELKSYNIVKWLHYVEGGTYGLSERLCARIVHGWDFLEFLGLHCGAVDIRYNEVEQ